MLLVVVVLAFAFGVALVVGLYLGKIDLPAMMMQRKLEARLEEVSYAPEEDKGPEAKVKALLKTRKQGPLPALDRILGESTRGSALGRWIEQSGTKATISSVLLMATVCAVAVAFIVAMTIRAPWALPIGAAIGFAMPFGMLSYKRTHRMRKFEEQFPEALDLIARALKAGHAFATGLKMVADEIHDPVGPEFRKTFDEQNFGLPLKDALQTSGSSPPRS
jgi:tight adherence protein B